jgi:two-component sensor histidine kinase
MARLGRRSLRSLLLFVLAATLLPVFLISFGQAYARLSLDREVVRQNLIDNVSLSAEQGRHVLNSAVLSLISLSSRDEVRGATPTCSATLAIAQLAMPYASNLARINANGLVTCSARAVLVSPDLSKRPWFANLSNAEEISFIGPAQVASPIRPTLVVALGLKASDGKPMGHIVVGIDLTKLQSGIQKPKGQVGARIALVDQNGRPIGGDMPVAKNIIAPDVRFETGQTAAELVTEVKDKNGDVWTYARAALVPGHLYVVYVMPDSILYSSTFRHVATDIALPLIALIFAGAGLWVAIQVWAIAPIEALRSLAKQYSVGRFDAPPPKLMWGPSEMIELRDDLSIMAERAVHRDDRLKRVAEQKDELLKEMHHRVKNNLQIILSLISLQARQASEPAQKAPLERVHARIMAVALVERLIVETDEDPTIDVHVLLEELCTLVRRMYQSDAQRVKLSFNSDHCLVPSDKATPIALFAFEAVTNAYTHGFGGQSQGQVDVKFAANENGVAQLEIADTGAGWNENDTETGTGHRLLQAFARQLGGKLCLSPSLNEGSHVRMTFSVNP